MYMLYNHPTAGILFTNCILNVFLIFVFLYMYANTIFTCSLVVEIHILKQNCCKQWEPYQITCSSPA